MQYRPHAVEVVHPSTVTLALKEYDIDGLPTICNTGAAIVYVLVIAIF
jgi:hypothetical protein